MRKIYKYKALAVGASAGGFEAFKELLKELREPLRVPMFVVQHIKKGGGLKLADTFRELTGMSIKEAEPGEPVLPGVIYICPADYHMAVEAEKTLTLLSSEPINYSRPSVDVLFDSAAAAYGEGLISLILSGSSSDGSLGTANVKKYGGCAAVQSPDDAGYELMPSSAIKSADVDFTGNIQEIADFIKERLNDLI